MKTTKTAPKPRTATVTVCGREMIATPREAMLFARLHPGRVVVACASDR